MTKRLELLAPAGSMANLKAAVSKGADSVYLGMRRFSARDFATNFNEKYLEDAVKITKSNNVKLYLAMNTLVKNHEVKDFFKQLAFAYSKGIDAVIIQELSFLEMIKKYFPDLLVHISTQAGVMNSYAARLLDKSDRITLARELSMDEIKAIRKAYDQKIEMFCHGALCACVSGSCLFSSLLGGRSGNRGKCAQPCRKKYNGEFFLSTKELCLIHDLPEIIKIGVDAVKIEGRMRTPYYVATATEAYRKAIDSYYEGRFNVPKQMLIRLNDAFNRGFTKGWLKSSNDIFNVKIAAGQSRAYDRETYEVKYHNINIGRPLKNVLMPIIKNIDIDGERKLMVRAYNQKGAQDAAKEGADIVYLDIFDDCFDDVKTKINCKLFAATPRIMLDKNIPKIKDAINEKKPDGILAGNLGVLNLGLNIPVHLDHNLNAFNDIDVSHFLNLGAMPIVSPELSFREMKSFRNRNFAVFVHGRLRLMTLRHNLKTGIIKDDRGARFFVNKIFNGTEILNEKELGMLGKSTQLLSAGINRFFVDTDKDVGRIVRFYRQILDGNKVDDSKLKKDYVLGWSFRRVV